MKKINQHIFYFAVIIFSNSNMLSGQNIDSIAKKDTLKRYDHSFNIGFAMSPLIHPFNIPEKKDFFSFQSGLFCSLKFGNGKAPFISSGLFFDLKKYIFVEKEYPPGGPDATIKFDYHYLYIPFLINFYIKKTYFSIGITSRIPIGFPSKYKFTARHYLPNPYYGLQIGYGKMIPLKQDKFDIHINPYLIIMGGSNEYTGSTYSVSGTISNFLLIGINLQILYKIKF